MIDIKKAMLVAMLAFSAMAGGDSPHAVAQKFPIDYSSVPNLGDPANPDDRVIATIDGESLRLLVAAYPVFRTAHVDLHEKIVQLTDCHEFLCVAAVTPHQTPGVYGSTGKTADIEIKVRKQDAKVVDWGYVR